MLTAVRRARAPLFLIQAENDFSTGSLEVLGLVIRVKGPPNQAKLYPRFGSTHMDGHGGFAARRAGIEIWGPDVLSFLQSVRSGER